MQQYVIVKLLSTLPETDTHAHLRLDQIRLDHFFFFPQCNAQDIWAIYPGESEQP